MKLNEIIQRVSSLYNKGVQSDDTALKRRHIYSMLVTVRAYYINQYLNRGIKPPEDYAVVLDFQVVEPHNITDNTLYQLEDCGLLRTQCEIPSPFDYNGEPLFIYVTSEGGAVRFGKTKFETIKYTESTRFAKFFPKFFYKDGYVYLTEAGEIKWIRIKYIPYDVVSMYKDPCLNNECVSWEDIDFPAPEKDIEPIIDMTVKSLVPYMLSTPQDLTNDSVDIRLQNTKK